MNKALWQSLVVHFVIVGIFLIGSLVLSQNLKVTKKIKVEIREVPKVEAQKQEEAPTVQISQKPPPPPPPKPVKKVFGLSKNTLQSEAPGAVEIKAGNTVAKEIDQEKLEPGDADSLPVPTEEYLVTQMPRLKNEVRIPYPPQAKKNNIEGPVVMDILIDEKGKVRSAQLVNGPGYGLDEAAMAAIYQFEFSPAVVEQKPVAVRIRYTYRFVLN